MALKKTFTTNFGVDAEYWKIGKVDVDFHTKKSIVNILGFVNAQARTENKKELMIKTVKFDGIDFTFDVTLPLIDQLYVKIKTLDIWSGAINC